MIQVNLDCEGPITQNDNAYELCEAFIPKGGDFFSRISKYDDYLADVEKRQGYKAGDTLKLVLPFLKAWGVTQSTMQDFSMKTIRLLRGAREMLPAISQRYPTFIISTSYRPYLNALCSLTGFPEQNIYCTDVDLDSYGLPDKEIMLLKELVSEITSQPLVQWPEEASSIDDLSDTDRRLIQRLDEIFFDLIPSMAAGQILRDVNPVGGREKAASVNDSVKRTGLDLSQVFYAGDSITDVQALEMVREGHGLALSFNGNSYAIRAAEWACLSDNTMIISTLAEIFNMHGSKVFSDIPLDTEGCSMGKVLLDFLKAKGVDKRLLSPVENMAQPPLLYLIEKTDIPALIKKSEAFRKDVRGMAVGELG